MVVNWQARRAERRHPPMGDFVEVDGVRLHYLEAGEGPPVVLLHGNSSLLDDVRLGIFDELAKRHRVIAFDRPGFGYSERPRRTVWTPEAQADLLRDALRALEVQRPVLYGHSWGAPLVITCALDYPDEIRGVVAASGYYYPHWRLDSLLAHLLVAPGVGPLLRNTITPVAGALFGNSAVRLLFDPSPVPETYAGFPASLTLRPSQIRASAEDGSTLRAWAERTSLHYGEILVPVIIVAGNGDRAVDYRKHSLRLHRDLPAPRCASGRRPVTWCTTPGPPRWSTPSRRSSGSLRSGTRRPRPEERGPRLQDRPLLAPASPCGAESLGCCGPPRPRERAASERAALREFCRPAPTASAALW